MQQSPTTAETTALIDALSPAVTGELQPLGWGSGIRTSTFEGWLKSQGMTLDALTQSQFSNQYKGWIEHLVQNVKGLGRDLDGDGVIQIDLRQNDPTGLPAIEGLSQAEVDGFFSGVGSVSVKTGKTTQERYFAESFAWPVKEDPGIDDDFIGLEPVSPEPATFVASGELM